MHIPRWWFALATGVIATTIGCDSSDDPDPGTSGGGTDGGVSADSSAGTDAGAHPDSSSGADGTPGNDSSSAADGTTGNDSSSGSCPAAATDPTLTWVEKSIDVGGSQRLYYQWLPQGYDPNRRYQVLYEFHGCSTDPDPQNNHPPTQTLSGAEAIHIRMRANEECWDLSQSGVEYGYFDAVVAKVETTLCTNPARRFATGYSSGAFMAHYLACWRGAMLRGVATIAGGYGPVPPTDCTGNVAALLIQDQDDQTVEPWKSESARDDHIARNGCDPNAATTPFEPAPCQQYADCSPGYLVVWCETSGQDHSSQPDLSAPAFWHFLSTLP